MLPLLLLITAQDARVAEFSKLIEPLKHQTASKLPDPRAMAAMDLILEEAGEKLLRAEDRDIAGKVLNPFRAAADKLDANFADEYRAPTFMMQFQKDLRAASVTFGAVSRIAIWQGPDRVKVPASLQWIYPYGTTLMMQLDGTIWLHSMRIQAAGNGTSTRFDLVSVKNGRAAVEFSKVANHTLDWGGIAPRGRTLTIDSLDYPKVLSVSAATPLFRRRSTYEIKGTKVTRLRSEALDSELRAVDQWLARAAVAARPSASQRRAQRLLGPSGMLEWSGEVRNTSSKTAEAVDAGITFHLKRSGREWSVTSVRFRE